MHGCLAARRNSAEACVHVCPEEKHTTTCECDRSLRAVARQNCMTYTICSFSLSLFTFSFRFEKGNYGPTVLIWPFGKRLVWLDVPKIQIRNPHSIQFTCHASFISLGKSKAPSSQKKRYHTWWLMGHDSVELAATRGRSTSYMSVHMTTVRRYCSCSYLLLDKAS